MVKTCKRPPDFAKPISWLFCTLARFFNLKILNSYKNQNIQINSKNSKKLIIKEKSTIGARKYNVLLRYCSLKNSGKTAERNLYMTQKENYRQKFYQLMEKFNYVFKEREDFKQCKEPYPPYWFVSNYGYVISVYRNGLKYIAPSIKRIGRKGKNGERPGRVWYYQYWTNGKKENVTMHKLIMDHSDDINEFTGDKSGEIHHIRPKSSFADNEGMKCNRADNLQKLPPDVHLVVTRLSQKTSEQIEEDWDRKAKKDNAKIIELPGEQVDERLVGMANRFLQQGCQGMIVIEGKNEQEMSAYPIGAIITHRNANGTGTESYRLISPKERDRLIGKDSPSAGEQKEV